MQKPRSQGRFVSSSDSNQMRADVSARTWSRMDDGGDEDVRVRFQLQLCRLALSPSFMRLGWGCDVHAHAHGQVRYACAIWNDQSDNT